MWPLGMAKPNNRINPAGMLSAHGGWIANDILHANSIEQRIINPI
jgi:hypothetical protein